MTGCVPHVWIFSPIASCSVLDPLLDPSYTPQGHATLLTGSGVFSGQVRITKVVVSGVATFTLFVSDEVWTPRDSSCSKKNVLVFLGASNYTQCLLGAPPPSTVALQAQTYTHVIKGHSFLLGENLMHVCPVVNSMTSTADTDTAQPAVLILSNPSASIRMVRFMKNKSPGFEPTGNGFNELLEHAKAMQGTIGFLVLHLVCCICWWFAFFFLLVAMVVLLVWFMLPCCRSHWSRSVEPCGLPGPGPGPGPGTVGQCRRRVAGIAQWDRVCFALSHGLPRRRIPAAAAAAAPSGSAGPASLAREGGAPSGTRVWVGAATWAAPGAVGPSGGIVCVEAAAACARGRNDQGRDGAWVGPPDGTVRGEAPACARGRPPNAPG